VRFPEKSRKKRNGRTHNAEKEGPARKGRKERENIEKSGAITVAHWKIFLYFLFPFFFERMSPARWGHPDGCPPAWKIFFKNGI
jgi:hypothetical protein